MLILERPAAQLSLQEDLINVNENPYGWDVDKLELWSNRSFVVIRMSKEITMSYSFFLKLLMLDLKYNLLKIIVI